MKKFLLSILIFIIAFSTLGGCMQGDSYPFESESSLSSSSETASSSTPSASEETSDSSVLPPPTSEDAPDAFEYGSDLTTCAPFVSRAPENYGTHCQLSVQTEVVAENSIAALKGVFNPIGAPVYRDYEIWTWASLCLRECFGEPIDLKNKILTYDVKTENCGVTSSFIVVDSVGNRTREVSFVFNRAAQSYPGIESTHLDNGWTRVTLDFFSAFFDDPVVSEGAEIFIMFTNRDCAAPNEDSVFYMDNMRLTEKNNSDAVSDIPAYNPLGYYRKNSMLSVKVVGNRVLSPSYANSAYFLQRFCDEICGKGLVTVSSILLGNGNVTNRYNAVFDTNDCGNVLFLQGFYSLEECTSLGSFLSKLLEISPKTELKILSGEHEEDFGMRAAGYYGVDFVDWQSAILTLKTDHGYGQKHLNASDGWHPNALSGFVAGMMMYMELYGEQPDFEAAKRIAKQEIWNHLLGANDEVKEGELSAIYTAAAKYALVK